MTQPKRLSQEAESSILQRLQDRDESALAELYDLLAPWVLGLAERMLHDHDEAEEVLSDVFMQVWTRIDQHDGRGALTPWVLSIARNRALDLLRRRERWWRKADRVEQARVTEDAVDPDHISRDASVPGWPVHREVHAALEALPLEQRRLVMLAFFDGLTHSEIARRTGEPLGTVKTRLRHAQQHLSESLRHVRDWLT